MQPPQGSEQKAQFAIDSDHDGMSDALEQALLVQFAPTFMVARHDCFRDSRGVCTEFEDSHRESRKRDHLRPGVSGKVFKRRSPTAEIHYYHL